MQTLELAQIKKKLYRFCLKCLSLHMEADGPPDFDTSPIDLPHTEDGTLVFLVFMALGIWTQSYPLVASPMEP